MITVVLLVLFAVQLSNAQRKRTKRLTYGDEVARTHVAHFDKSIELDAATRDSLKLKYRQHISSIKQTLDTLDISERRRLRLLAILKKNPFDEKLLKIIASVDGS